MLEDTVLYVGRTIAHLASALLMLPPLPYFFDELDLLLGKIEITVPSVFAKIAHLLPVRAVAPVVAQKWCASPFLAKALTRFFVAATSHDE